MKTIAATLVASALLAGTTLAQGLNLDVQVNPVAVPNPDFGAASGQLGDWSAIRRGMNMTPIADVTGSFSGASVSFNLAPGGFANGSVQTIGAQFDDDVERLYNDFASGVPNTQVRVHGLRPGRYGVFIYGWVPGGVGSYYASAGPQGIGYIGSMNHGSTFPGGFVPGNFFNPTSNSNYVASNVVVKPGETMFITALCGGALGPGGNIIPDSAGEPGGPFDEAGASGGPGNTDPLLNPFCTIAGIQIVPIFGQNGCDPVLDNSVGGRPRIAVYAQTNAGGGSQVNAPIDITQDVTLQTGFLPTGTLPGNRSVVTFVSNVQTSMQAQIQPSCPPASGGGLPVGVDSFRCIGNPSGSEVYRLDPTPNDLSDPFGIYTRVITPAEWTNLETLGLDIDPGADIYIQSLYQDDAIPADPCQGDPMLRWTASRRVRVL